MLPKRFDFIPVLSSMGRAKKLLLFRRKQIIFSNGDLSDSIFYIEKGTVKLSVTTASGKEAFLALLGRGDFFGESCLASDNRTRFHTATAVTDMRVMKIDRLLIVRMLRANSEFAYAFITYLVARNQHIEQDLADSLLNSAKGRLVRVLSSLERSDKSDQAGPVPRVSQQDLANMIGVSRQRVNVLLHQLRKSSRGPADDGNGTADQSQRLPPH
jgi:CRP-like cAMP-binding protein